MPNSAQSARAVRARAVVIYPDDRAGQYASDVASRDAEHLVESSPSYGNKGAAVAEPGFSDWHQAGPPVSIRCGSQMDGRVLFRTPYDRDQYGVGIARIVATPPTVKGVTRAEYSPQ